MFERCYVVTLDRRPDRYERFIQGLPADWPFPKPERFSAIDGQLVPHPKWWRMGAGAWGCMRSHLLLCERCLNEGVESVLLLEDDAVFPDGFTGKASEFLAAVPANWEMIYLGGQLLKVDRERPIRINPLVYKPFNVNRTHAFALRGKEFMGTVYQHLHEWGTWKYGHHIDHHFGVLHQSGKHAVYCPGDWLVGQADGPSDIKAGNKVFPERYWPGAKAASGNRHAPDAPVRPFVAVIGLHSSGSSAMAGVLHHLGAFLGKNLTGYYGKDPERDCGFEAAKLARICEAAIPFPQCRIMQPLDIITAELRAWARANQGVANSSNTIAAGKYPMLCRLGPQLREAVGGSMKVVHIDRPLEESILSIQRRCPKRDPEQLAAHQRWLWEGKQEFLATLPPEDVLTVSYDRLLSNPREVAEAVAPFAGLKPTAKQIERAVKSVDAGKRHVKSVQS